jgi:hypothetical protein
MSTGWIGEESELLQTLRSFGAEKDAEGLFVIFDQPVVKGMDGSIVVHGDTKCQIDGKKVSVAYLLSQTSYGLKVMVF